MQYTLADIKQAIKYNTDNGLYSDNEKFMRVYFTYNGGKYSGQKDSVKSEYQLNKLINDINNNEYLISEIEILTTEEGYKQLVNKA